MLLRPLHRQRPRQPQGWTEDYVHQKIHWLMVLPATGNLFTLLVGGALFQISGGGHRKSWKLRRGEGHLQVSLGPTAGKTRVMQLLKNKIGAKGSYRWARESYSGKWTLLTTYSCSSVLLRVMLKRLETSVGLRPQPYTKNFQMFFLWD